MSSSSSDDYDTTNTFAVVSIVCSVAALLWVVFCFAWYIIRRAPVQGSRYSPHGSCGAMHPAGLIALALVAFVLNITALGLDTWCSVSRPNTTSEIIFGVTGIRVMWEQSEQQFVSYSDAFPSDSRPSNAVRLGGALTLMCGILSLLCLLTVLVSAILLLCKRYAGARAAVYRASFLSFACTFATCMCWALGAYLTLNQIFDSSRSSAPSLSLGVSYYLSVAAFWVSVIVAYGGWSVLVRSAPEPGSLAYGAQLGAMPPTHQVAYGVPVVQQQVYGQPQMYAQQPQQYHQPQQAAYGVPVQQGYVAQTAANYGGQQGGYNQLAGQPQPQPQHTAQ